MMISGLVHFASSVWRCLARKVVPLAAVVSAAGLVLAAPVQAAGLKTMRTGLGTGRIASTPPGISCGADCDETYTSPISVTLTVTPAAGSSFVRWHGDCSGTATTCTVTMGTDRSVRAELALTTAIPTITSFTPTGLDAYLMANPTVNTPARFLKALPAEFKQNWLMMSRSESLQTGTAETPRFLLPSANTQAVFTFGLAAHASYPGAHPNAIEYMQWDAGRKDFRFHEIVLDAIPAMGAFPARSRAVSADDARCSKCHSTRNVLNRSSFPGTTGIPPGTVKEKSKPNWDTYDSWGGMLPFNRDRIYKGSVEAAAFRRIFNPWTWRTNNAVRSFVEQLELQPPSVPAGDEITRLEGGANDGHVQFFFDGGSTVLSEPAPVGTSTASIAYSFDGLAGTSGTTVQRGGDFVTLHHSATPTNPEGRAVQFFDLLGGADGNLNQQRIGDELASHRFATGGVPLDARPIALAITKDCFTRAMPPGQVTPALASGLAFFTARHGGMTIHDVFNDTLARSQNIPERKADIEKLNLDRTGDVYLYSTAPANGLVQQYGAATSFKTDTALSRLRQEVFRRPIDDGTPDASDIGGFYVDREDYLRGAGSDFNTERVALYRYFLEPLGVSVDKWSMGVRGRSRTYTFADVFKPGFLYVSTLTSELEASLTSDPFPGLAPPFTCPSLITAINSAFLALPPPDATPTFTDVQRIYNKSCIECHGGLDYPPFSEFFPATYLDLSEDEAPPPGRDRLQRSYDMTSDFTTTDETSYLFQRIIKPTEECPNGVMPCGGPKLSQVDVQTIRRWIDGGRLYTHGDPHLRTIDGTNYDFQSAGEFVLLRGPGVDIQTRQTAVDTAGPLGPNPHTGLSSCVSINTAAAIRVGPHRITYQPNLSGRPDPEGLQLRIDGKLIGRLGEKGVVLPAGGRVLPTTAPGGIQIEYLGGTDIVVTPGWWDYYQLWYLNIDVRHARATEGVMGAIAPLNWLPALPDGKFLGTRPASLHQRYLDLYETFADAWRVSDHTSLFDYAPGTSTKTFTIDAWPREEPRSCRVPRDPDQPPGKPPLPPLPREVAQQHCRPLVEEDRRANCELDVMVTGEPRFAQTYLLAEKIQRNAIPAAPVLLAPEDDKTDVTQATTFTWRRTTDENGGDLTYLHCLWLAGERPTFDKCKELPKQTGPYAGRVMSRRVTELEAEKAYFWKVVVQDGQGGTAESHTRRFATGKSAKRRASAS